MARKFNEHLYETAFLGRLFAVRQEDWRVIHAVDRIKANGSVIFKAGEVTDIRINEYGYRIVQLPRSAHPTNGIHNLIAHRVLWALFHNRNPGRLLIDHIDRDRLNNCPDNLRAINERESLLNRSNTGASSKLGVIGVTVDDRARAGTRMYQAKTRLPDRTMYNIGCFATVREAAEAYDVWVTQNFGPDASTNRSLGLI